MTTLPRNTILVIGHRNPDTDAICSALSYARLYHHQTGRHTLACHLDQLAPEARWVLKHFGLDTPQTISDVFLRVGDVAEAAPTIRPEQSLAEARELLRVHDLRALAVVDADGRLVGMLEHATLSDRFIDLLARLPEIDEPLSRLLDILQDEELLVGAPDTQLRGRLYVAVHSPAQLARHIQPGDIVVAGDVTEVQLAALAAGASCLVLTDSAPADPALIAAARERGTIVIRTPDSALRVVFAIQSAAPVSVALRVPPATLLLDDLLTDGQRALRDTGRPALPVVDDQGFVRGLLLRRHLLQQAQREVILTDHNHPSQAAPGVVDSQVVAIVDHHNLGGLQTLAPLTMQIEPVGCTCTLIAEQALRAGYTPPPAVAGAMLAAILSDTVQFRSPTTTARDQAAAAWLAELCSAQIPDLARAMFRSRLPNPVPAPPWWIGTDRKEFSFGKHTISISQIELVDIEHVMPDGAALRAELADVVKRNQLAAAFLALTDIVGERSLLLADSPHALALAARAFNVTPAHDRLELPGVMSRKQQIVPPIAAVLLKE